MQTKHPVKLSKRSSSSKTSQRKSIPKDGENSSSNDPNDPRVLSIYSSIKMRYPEDAENEEESNDTGELGLQIQSSSSQLKYKYLGMFYTIKTRNYEFFDCFFEILHSKNFLIVNFICCIIATYLLKQLFLLHISLSIQVYYLAFSNF